MTQQLQATCYGTSFNILECLEKGEMHFIASNKLEDKTAETQNKYTMHVIYVNNNWCYDTYSGRQYPLERALKAYQGKLYKVFTYEDIANKTYDDFRKEQYPEFKKWCEANDCEEQWIKKD